MRRIRRAAVAGLALAATAASPTAGGEQHIADLAGCFEVTYRFAEDGRHDLFVRDEPLAVREWVGRRSGADGAIVLLHVSITPGGRAVAHWHEVWRRHGEASHWTQQVWSDHPDHPRRELRYACTAPWTMNRWQCHAGRAPKPFRDAGAPFGFDRTDYAWLDRENILLVTGRGWIHNEHNRKVDADGATVAHELGWITYARIDEAACRPAIEAFGAPPDGG